MIVPLGPDFGVRAAEVVLSTNMPPLCQHFLFVIDLVRRMLLELDVQETNLCVLLLLLTNTKVTLTRQAILLAQALLKHLVVVFVESFRIFHQGLGSVKFHFVLVRRLLVFILDE